MNNSVRNTRSDMEQQEHRVGFLAEALVVGTPNAIEAQEAAGQMQFVASDVLPVNGADDDRLKSLGFELGGVVVDDPLFRYAKLPPGWSRRPTEHPMYAEIVDDQGRRRIEIFYKAAFYDRRADMRFVEPGDE